MKKSRLIALLSALMIVAAMAFVVGCGSDDDSDSGNNGSLDSELVSAGTLTVGSDIPYAPFEFGEAPDYEGFDIDLVNAIADHLDLEVQIKPAPFESIFTDVAQGKYDLVAAASTITKEREQTVNFSQPYYDSQQALLVSDGSDIKTVEDLDGKIVAAQDGTTGLAYANDETGASQVRGYPLGPAAIAALKAGQVEATIIDRPVAEEAVEKGQTGFEVATLIPTGEFYGFAMAKDTPKLEEGVNDALSKMKDDGTLNELYQKWFDEDAPETLFEHTSSEGVAID